MNEQDKTLLRQVFREARKSRLREGDLDGVMDCARLEIKILDPPTEIDWAATRLGKRVAARDRRR
jgi:hypothetical protein